MSIDDCMMDVHVFANIDRQLHPEKRFNVIAMVLSKKGKILATDFNSITKTHPLQAMCAKAVGRDMKVFLHAEIAALVRARKQPFTMVVARVLKNGELASANPCPVCRLAMKKAGVREIYYSNPNGTWTRDLVEFDG